MKIFTFISILFLALVCAPAISAQELQRPKLKDFGSSLKRLKWDPTRNAVVEGKPKSKPNDVANKDDVVRVETLLVLNDLLVLDARGQPVQGLTEKDFLITEDGQPQQVGSFSLGDNTEVPRTIVLIIDYSSSQFPFIKTSIEAARTLIDKLGPRDRVAIVTDEVELLADFTSNKTVLKERLQSLEKKSKPYYRSPLAHRGRSNVYSALMATLRGAFDREDLRPLVILQTDGDAIQRLRDPIITPSIPPNLSPEELRMTQQLVAGIKEFNRQHMTEFSFDDVRRAAEKSRATIYTITPGWQLIGLSPDDELKQFDAWRKKITLAWVPPEGLKEAKNSRPRQSIDDLRIQAREMRVGAISPGSLGNYYRRVGEFLF